MIDPLPLPSQADLCARFDYNPRTGDLVWKPGTKRAGHAAGTLTSSGYRQVNITATRYVIHRIIWKMVHGIDPEWVDHKDGDKTNNKITNLRSIPHQENHKNCPRRNDNKTGVTGVTRPNNSGKWRADIRVNKMPIYLGCFDTLDEAAAARKAAEIKYGFHPNHGREA